MNDLLLKRISIGLGIIGVIDTVYLSWIKFTSTVAICSVGDCSAVNSSSYSEIFGIPIAILGLAAYVVIIAIHLLEDQEGWIGDNALMLIFGLTLIGVLYSAYLTYVELFILRAICPYCVLSAVAITLMFGVAITRMLREN
jgi:uncharacterized membrane protein